MSLRGFFRRLFAYIFGTGTTDEQDDEPDSEVDVDVDAEADAESDTEADADAAPDENADGDDQDDDEDDGGAGGAEADGDADAESDTEVDAGADTGASDDVDADTEADVNAEADVESESVNHSSDESVGLSWPPREPVSWPERPDDPDGTIEVRLYHDDDSLGLRACRQTAPYLEWAMLDAWADRFNLDAEVTVREEPVPDAGDDTGSFDNWIWTDECDMAKDANMLVVESGEGGAAGGYSGFVEGPEDFEGWGYDPEETDEDGNPAIVPYGGGEPRKAVNTVIHEVLHCLGLSHNGRFSEFEEVEWYGTSYCPPLWTTYRGHSRFTPRLCEANRTVRPTVQ
jgi:hypothetical protein